MKKSKLTVTHIWETANPLYVQVSCSQSVEDGSSNPVGVFLAKDNSRNRQGKALFAKSHGLKVGDILNDANPAFAGATIAIQESHTPFFKGQEAKINPSTKATITSGGRPVYRQGIITLEGAKDSADILLPSDKVAVSTEVEA